MLGRLPPSWHANCIVRLEESREIIHLNEARVAVACVARVQFKIERIWVVTMYTSCLDTLSDEAVQWVLARELGRVVADESRLQQPILNETASQDERAESQALRWGATAVPTGISFITSLVGFTDPDPSIQS
jgi:hypothetical protein